MFPDADFIEKRGVGRAYGIDAPIPSGRAYGGRVSTRAIRAGGSCVWATGRLVPANPPPTMTRSKCCMAGFCRAPGQTARRESPGLGGLRVAAGSDWLLGGLGRRLLLGRCLPAGPPPPGPGKPGWRWAGAAAEAAWGRTDTAARCRAGFLPTISSHCSSVAVALSGNREQFAQVVAGRWEADLAVCSYSVGYGIAKPRSPEA